MLHDVSWFGFGPGKDLTIPGLVNGPFTEYAAVKLHSHESYPYG